MFPEHGHSIYQLLMLTQFLQVCFFRSSMLRSSVKKFIISLCRAQEWKIFRSHMERTRSLSSTCRKKHQEQKSFAEQKKATRKDGNGSWRKDGQKNQPIRKTPGEKSFISTIGNWKSSWNWSFFHSYCCLLKISSLPRTKLHSGAQSLGGCLYKIFNKFWVYLLFINMISCVCGSSGGPKRMCVHSNNTRLNKPF